MSAVKNRDISIATDPEGCMISTSKTDLTRLVLYAFKWRSIHLFDCLEAGRFIVCCAWKWRQRARKERQEREKST